MIFKSRLLLPSLILSFFSCLIVYSVALDRFYYQLGFFLLGLGFFFLVKKIGLQPFWVLSPFIYFLTALFLLLTFIFGQTVRGSTRWLGVGFFRLQVSEWAKLALLLFLSYLAGVSKITLKRFVYFFLSFIFIFLLVFIEPDLGSSLILGVIFLSIFLLFKIPKKYKMLFLFLGVLLLPLVFPFLKTYQVNRLKNFLNPYHDPSGSGYNVIQSVVAIGSGRFLGKGLGLGSQSQLHFLPEQQTDFIFASFVEELGFLGGLVLLGFYFYLLKLMLDIYHKQTELGASMICLSIFMVFFIQIIINIGMNMGIMPVTGLPLPLLSVGGNSILVSFILLGIVDSLDFKVKKRSSLLIS